MSETINYPVCEFGQRTMVSKQLFQSEHWVEAEKYILKSHLAKIEAQLGFIKLIEEPKIYQARFVDQSLEIMGIFIEASEDQAEWVEIFIAGKAAIASNEIEKEYFNNKKLESEK